MDEPIVFMKITKNLLFIQTGKLAHQDENSKSLDCGCLEFYDLKTLRKSPVEFDTNEIKVRQVSFSDIHNLIAVTTHDDLGGNNHLYHLNLFDVDSGEEI